VLLHCRRLVLLKSLSADKTTAYHCTCDIVLRIVLQCWACELWYRRSWCQRSSNVKDGEVIEQLSDIQFICVEIRTQHVLPPV
jgi:hypothetical protein